MQSLIKLLKSMLLAASSNLKRTDTSSTLLCYLIQLLVTELAKSDMSDQCDDFCVLSSTPNESLKFPLQSRRAAAVSAAVVNSLSGLVPVPFDTSSINIRDDSK